MSGKRTAIYCRVDSGGHSKMRRDALTMQKQRLETYAKKQNLQIVGYYEDDGYSGHDLSRPGLVQLIKDSNHGAFELVLVANYSRLYRGNRWNEPQWPFQVYSINQLEHDMLKR